MSECFWWTCWHTGSTVSYPTMTRATQNESPFFSFSGLTPIGIRTGTRRTTPEFLKVSVVCLEFFWDINTVTILGPLSTCGTTTIWALEGPGKTEDCGGWGCRAARLGREGEGGEGGGGGAFLKALLPSLAGVYASGNELHHGQTAYWLESDMSLHRPKRSLIQSVVLFFLFVCYLRSLFCLWIDQYLTTHS